MSETNPNQETKEQASNSKISHPDWIGRAMSIIALTISCVAFAYQMGWIGRVRFLSPPGYAVLRGLGAFPSDHVAVPIAWQNTTSRPILISKIRLQLSELTSQKKYSLQMVGELSGMSDKVIGDFLLGDWIALQPQSLSVHNIVFGLKNRWDVTDTNYQFHLLKDTGNGPLRAQIEYTQVDSSSTAVYSFVLVESMPLFPGIARIADKGYDFYWLNP